jgi:preprotein translocase subunit SecG
MRDDAMVVDRPEQASERVFVILALQILLIVTSVLLVVLVLLHKGKGGGLSDMFGGGLSSAVGGSSVAERNLDRITLAITALWVASIVGLGLLMKG